MCQMCLPAPILDWRARESRRFETGEYTALPEIAGFVKYNIAFERDHFLHMSTSGQTDMVAYTQSEEKGLADRQVVIGFGRYLKRFQPLLTDAAISELVSALRGASGLKDNEVQFTRERDVINRIFETPLCAGGRHDTSCMFGKFADWEHRPYHVYAGSPDVAVAFLMESGEIVARSVVMPDSKEYVRIYASAGKYQIVERFQHMLAALAYSQGELEGCRLTKVKRNGTSGSDLLPYIDNGGLSVRDGGAYWIVCEEDDSRAVYHCGNANGYPSNAGRRCDLCDRPEDDCECSTCECCDSLYYETCSNCTFCEDCDGCTEHGGCDCERCSNCERIISDAARYRYRRCQCERCENCGDLIDDCGCDRCERCERLASDCECEDEDEDEGGADVEVSIEIIEPDVMRAGAEETRTNE